jgi:hypothetical protein
MPMKFESLRVRFLICLVAAILAAPTASLAVTSLIESTIGNSDDPWESDTFDTLLRDGFAQGRCVLRFGEMTIDPALIAPVPIAMRAVAIDRLQDTGAVPLPPTDVAQLLNLPEADSANKLAGQVAHEAVVELEGLRRLALEERKGSWSRADQYRLDALNNMSQDPSVQAFLVRALAANNLASGYDVVPCGTSLFVRHMTWRGQTSTPVQRTPLILFLKFAPTAVHVKWMVDAHLTTP